MMPSLEFAMRLQRLILIIQQPTTDKTQLSQTVNNLQQKWNGTALPFTRESTPLFIRCMAVRNGAAVEWGCLPSSLSQSSQGSDGSLSINPFSVNWHRPKVPIPEPSSLYTFLREGKVRLIIQMNLVLVLTVRSI